MPALSLPKGGRPDFVAQQTRPASGAANEAGHVPSVFFVLL